MSLIIRYVNESHEIQESFVTFMECEPGTTEAAIATLIENAFQSLDMELVAWLGLFRVQLLKFVANILRFCMFIVPLTDLTCALHIRVN